MTTRRPLDDIRIVAVEQYGAGPFGSVHLADLGADVIKIEDPRNGGDVGRYVPPHQSGEDSLFFEAFNRNKRSLNLDLHTAAGQSVLRDLVACSDAVYSNLRGDIPERLRLRYADLCAANPRIVCCSLSGFGMTGPRRAEPAYDYILQGMTGWMSLTGEPDGPPAKSGLSLVDYSGGYVAALALMSGIHAARRDGVGMDCDTSLFDVAMGMLTYVATWNLTAGHVPQRMAHSSHPSIVPFGAFETADGWIVVVCAKEKFFVRLCDVLGTPELPADERFNNVSSRYRHRAELLPILERALRAKRSAEWLALLREAGVPCGPVNTVEEAFLDPQTDARGLIVTTEHPHFGTVRSIGSPVRVGDAPPPARRAPQRNEHADDILRGLLHYGDQKIGELSAAGAFG
jgi:crotonobetainyl-CoA:carnitine CoA-transferase CaiB-like acyl-CoA transferase